MYSYYYDDETGGIVLTRNESIVHHEVRPVWAEELRKIGFDRYWDFDDSETPYMWCDLGRYYYRGRLVAKTKFNPDAQGRYDIVLCDKGLKLQTVDVDGMRQKNNELFGEFRQQTIQRLKDLFEERAARNEFWYMAWSGGKDSIAMFDVVSHALDVNDFVVSFSDTDMEFPQTYQAAREMESLCKNLNARFYTARAEMSAEESWTKIGPPSRHMRWCCSVHKGTPQTLLVRSLADGRKVVAMTGCRKYESFTRSEYTFVKTSKIKSATEVLPIVDWGSAEVWLDILCNKLILNNAYKYGMRRVGCALCPMGGDDVEYSAIDHAPEQFNVFWKIIQEHKPIIEGNTFRSWHGRMYDDLTQGAKQELREEEDYGGLTLYATEFRQDWKEWIKTVCDIEKAREGAYVLKFRGSTYDFYEEESDKPEFAFKFRFPAEHNKNARDLKNYLKKVFRRAVYCLHCRFCSANCSRDAVKFHDGKVQITDACVKCGACYKTKVACVVWESRVVHNNREEIIERSRRKLEDAKKAKEEKAMKKDAAAAEAERNYDGRSLL